MDVIFSHSPHVKSANSTKKIMINVVIALLPAFIMGVVYFGLSALIIVLTAVVSAILSEIVYLLIMKKNIKTILREFDFSSVVTGLLVGLVLGSNSPIYVPIFASVFAIIVVKMIFGGTGRNLVNPAIAGRVFVFLSFTSLLTSNWAMPFNNDITTGSTILTDILSGTSTNISNLDLFLGIGVAGCIGETCKLALLVGGIYLVIRGILNFRWPLLYILTTGIFTVIINGFDFSTFLPSILSGGLFLGAIFMATDYVTSPCTKIGNYVYFIMLGILTALLRWATGIEVVSFAILLMNLVVPLIDKFIINRPFGYKKEAKNDWF